MSLSDHYLNITERNVRQYAREQYERDLYVGRSEYQQRHEAYQEWKQEHCMSGVAMTENDSSVSQMLKEFVSNHIAHLKDANAVKDLIPAGKAMFVRHEGTLFLIRKSCATSPFELPVIVSAAEVIEG